MGFGWLYICSIHRWWSRHYVMGFIECKRFWATKKTVSSGLWFMLYASGNIIGANIFYAYQAPRYYSGVIGLLSSYSGIMAIIIAYRFLLSWRNKNKDKIQGEMTEEMKQRAIIDGFKGFTDFENPGFRYSL